MKELSDAAKLTWNIAAAEALSAGFKNIEPEHVMIGLTELGKILVLPADQLGFSAEQIARARAESQKVEKLFGVLGLEPSKFRRDLRNHIGDGNFKHSSDTIHRSRHCKEMFDRAGELARYKSGVTSMDLIRSIAADPGPVLSEFLIKKHISTSALASAALKIDAEASADKAAIRRDYIMPSGRLLGKFGQDLVYQASQGILHECVGRNEEINAILNLMETGEINPILVGKNGVGKGVIVETIALRIWNGKQTGRLASKTIVTVNSADLENAIMDKASSPNFAADFLNELYASPNVLVYFEDFHRIAALGTEFAPFKDAIHTNRLKIIAGTDEEHFGKIAFADPAFARKFSKIPIHEPNKRETLAILHEWKSKLEVIHGVKITDKALAAAAELGSRFEMEYFMPKKALRLLDKACAKAKIPHESLSNDTNNRLSHAARKFKIELTGDVNELRVAQAASETINISLEMAMAHINGGISPNLFYIEDTLNKKILGQQDAVRHIARRIKSEYAGGTGHGILTMLFAGPKGVGKTEAARELAYNIFGHETEPIVINMEKYGSEQELDRLFTKKGILDNLLDSHPLTAVIFDGIENAAPEFYDFFTAMAVDAKTRAAQQTMGAVSGSVFLLTATGKFRVQSQEIDGYEIFRQDYLKTVENMFPLMFLEKMDEIVIFSHLSEKAATRLLISWIDTERTRLKEEYGADLFVSREAERHLLREAILPEYGAKRLKTVFHEIFRAELERVTASGDLKKSVHWRAVVENNKLKLVPKTFTGGAADGEIPS